ncbi:MAG: SurA N-terminal domain-containing protein, partial [Rubrobacteridae bacterium]|nr:SurA N-terminal domain-containing protein [Rubrobacteridae bacterium]
MRFFKHGLTVALVFAVTMTVAGCSNTSKKTTELPEGVAASINGKNIMLADVEGRVQRTIDANPSILATKDQAATRENLKAQALEELIGIELTSQEADKKGIKVSEKEYDKGIKDLMKKNGIKDMAALKKVLEERKIPYEDFKKDYIERTKIKKLADQLTKDLKITDKEAEKDYKENKASYDTPAQVKVQHVLVQDITKAGEVLAKLKKGKDMGKLAAEYSIDPGS